MFLWANKHVEGLKRVYIYKFDHFGRNGPNITIPPLKVMQKCAHETNFFKSCKFPKDVSPYFLGDLSDFWHECS